VKAVIAARRVGRGWWHGGIESTYLLGALVRRRLLHLTSAVSGSLLIEVSPDRDPDVVPYVILRKRTFVPVHHDRTPSVSK